MYVGQSTRDLVAGELIERYGQEMLQAGDRMAALEEDMLALMEDLAPFLEHGQATFHDETMDLHWFDDGFNENGSGPVVPTPGLEPGSGSSSELTMIIRHLAQEAAHALRSGRHRLPRRFLEALATRSQS